MNTIKRTMKWKKETKNAQVYGESHHGMLVDRSEAMVLDMYVKSAYFDGGPPEYLNLVIEAAKPKSKTS